VTGKGWPKEKTQTCSMAGVAGTPLFLVHSDQSKSSKSDNNPPCQWGSWTGGLYFIQSDSDFQVDGTFSFVLRTHSVQSRCRLGEQTFVEPLLCYLEDTCWSSN
jgi:hypothetical protein